ncbi:MAG: hypothetical protein HRT42_14840 [Campylobacteraceae bacterium]|nr:hypothetical protein [Campylobacteraceae bacterium]
MFNSNKKVFLSIAGMDPGWIVGKIAEDIKAYLEKENIVCRYGKPGEYNDEEICYHLGYAYATPQKNAEINSIFITHIDDKFKENMIVGFKDDFDSFICMSQEDKEFLLQLGFDKNKTFGVTLPVRNDYVRPLNLGIFSGYYKDGRKNDKWLIDFIKSEKNIYLVNFVFIGPSWNDIFPILLKNDCTFEWHTTSRQTPYEYKFQQDKLSKLDYYFYMGFDGGAMGSYDAYAYGVPLLIANDGFHRDIPGIDLPVNDYNEFQKELKKIITKQKNKIDFFNNNNVENYVIKLFKIWNNLDIDNTNDLNVENLMSKKQNNYFGFTLRRLMGSIKRKFLK